MAEVWRKTESGLVEYVPTGDGEFEAWMDKHEPTWQSANTDSIKFWREIWDAGAEWADATS